jgi:3-oxoacyl-[acyl-carrier protein] reductase
MPLVENRATVQSSEHLYPDLAGKRVLITGALEPEGAVLARAFAGHDCRLVLQMGLEPAPRGAWAEDLREAAKGLRVLPGDFRTSEGVDRFADAALRTHGGIDIVVNIARLPDALAAARDERELNTRLAESLRPLWQLTQRAIERMRGDRTPGAVLNVLAQAKSSGPRGLALHAIAKTALEAITQAEAKPAFADGIRVYGLIEARAPGARTWDDLVATAMDAANTDVLDTVWSSALFCASERGGWMNGATLSVGG